MCKNYTYEVCPICEKEVRLEAEFKIQICPCCGSQILPCSLCYPHDNCDCKNCELERKVTEIRKDAEPTREAMHKAFIGYEGKKYPTIVLPMSWVDGREYDTDPIVQIAPQDLWEAISENLCVEGADEREIDDSVYRYCESGFIEGNPTKEEITQHFAE